MKPAKKKRLLLITIIFSIFSIAISLLIYALGADLNHYYSLDQIAKNEAPKDQRGIRVGGMVSANSFVREEGSLNVRFHITDFQNPELEVRYTGILPDLFREGQGIIARGTLSKEGYFQAEEVLAKHDENYMPPEVKADLERSGYQHQSQRKDSL